MIEDSLEITRRQFVVGLTAAGVVAGLSGGMRPLSAIPIPPRRQGPNPTDPRVFDLEVNRSGIGVPGASRKATSIGGSVPGPLLRLREGEDVVINVTNRLNEDTSIHWHGLLVPASMDGVPGFSFHGIRPGETFSYRFTVKQSGTYWYHSHSGGQEQEGAYAPMIIDPAQSATAADVREHVVMLSEWSNEAPKRILRNLKGDAGYYNYGKRTVFQFFGELFRSPGKTLRDRDMWGRMRMDPTDIADVSGATYTYLMNGHSADQNWNAVYAPGERVRLRIINAAAMSYFDFKIPGLRMTVVQADGQEVEPVVVDELRIAVAETYDVIVEPEAGQAYTLFAQSMDRSGFACGTLATRSGESAPIPEMDPRPLRTMGMAGHDHAAMMDSASLAGAAADPHAGHVGMEAAQPHKVLAYSDLAAVVPNSDVRAPEKEVLITLNGDMERYFWTLNGNKLEDSDPIRLRVGQRVRLLLANESMMEHPMHLHGVFMELQNGQAPERAPRKHTVSVPPFETVVAHLTFEEPGDWAFHCHLMYHMMTGMFVRVIVEPAQELPAGDVT